MVCGAAVRVIWVAALEGVFVGRCLVVYDISNTRVRTKIADLCLDYGLSRIQLSAYLGSPATWPGSRPFDP